MENDTWYEHQSQDWCKISVIKLPQFLAGELTKEYLKYIDLYNLISSEETGKFSHIVEDLTTVTNKLKDDAYIEEVIKMCKPLFYDKDFNPKQQKIPTKIRKSVWTKYIGTGTDGLCYCCGINDISIFSFEVGHVNPENTDDLTTTENLRPICPSCYSSMNDDSSPKSPVRCCHVR
jgi:hypothetical protein